MYLILTVRSEKDIEAPVQKKWFFGAFHQTAYTNKPRDFGKTTVRATFDVSPLSTSTWKSKKRIRVESDNFPHLLPGVSYIVHLNKGQNALVRRDIKRESYNLHETNEIEVRIDDWKLFRTVANSLTMACCPQQQQLQEYKESSVFYNFEDDAKEYERWTVRVQSASQALHLSEIHKDNPARVWCMKYWAERFAFIYGQRAYLFKWLPDGFYVSLYLFFQEFKHSKQHEQDVMLEILQQLCFVDCFQPLQQLFVRWAADIHPCELTSHLKEEEEEEDEDDEPSIVLFGPEELLGKPIATLSNEQKQQLVTIKKRKNVEEEQRPVKKQRVRTYRASPRDLEKFKAVVHENEEEKFLDTVQRNIRGVKKQIPETPSCVVGRLLLDGLQLSKATSQTAQHIMEVYEKFRQLEQLEKQKQSSVVEQTSKVCLYNNPRKCSVSSAQLRQACAHIPDVEKILQLLFTLPQAPLVALPLCTGETIFRKSVLDAKKQTIDKLRKLTEQYKPWQFDNSFALPNIQNWDQLKQFVERVCKNPLNVLEGGAGTGKTTALAVLIAYVVLHAKELKLPDEYKIRISLKTNQALNTIKQKILDRLQSIPVPKDTLIFTTFDKALFRPTERRRNNVVLELCDECGMDDERARSKFLQRMTWNAQTRVVLCGDTNQIQPFGDLCGALFCGVSKFCKEMQHEVPVSYTRLLQVMRQDEDNAIPLNANAILAGKNFLPIHLHLDKPEQFALESQRLVDFVEKKLSPYVEKSKDTTLQDLRILTPTNSAREVLLQQCVRFLHANTLEEMKITDKEHELFCVGDQIICSKSVAIVNIEKKKKSKADEKEKTSLDNGTEDVIEEILVQSGKQWLPIASFHQRTQPGMVLAKLARTQAHVSLMPGSGIELGYAVTANKMQGGQRKAVWLCFLQSELGMKTEFFRRNHLYSAKTRPEKSFQFLVLTKTPPLDDRAVKNVFTEIVWRDCCAEETQGCDFGALMKYLF